MSTIQPDATPIRQAPPANSATASLTDVDIVAELDARPRREADYGREDRAFGLLAMEMAENPRNMLQKLVEIAVDLCAADTAGISLLDGDVFRWEAVAGVFSAYRGGTMPRAASPCGVCIDRNATQLMHLPDRCFPALWAEPRFVEALLIPFHDHATPIGTVWIVSHTFDRTFDKEDERVVRILAQFASAGWQLWKTSEAAGDANRRKDDFMALLGHELRNPMAAIATAATLLQQRCGDDPSAMRAIQVLLRQSHHISRLLNDLLDTARINHGKLELEKRPVDLYALVVDAAEAKRRDIDARQQRLSVVPCDGDAFVEGDPVRLSQVIHNLLDNASKYTPEHGSIAVTVSASPAEVSVEVRDTGRGIAASQLNKIFDPFVQAPTDGGDRIAGLGLGLALIRSLTELHGGVVSAVSDGPGFGSTFIVRLPRQR